MDLITWMDTVIYESLYAVQNTTLTTILIIITNTASAIMLIGLSISCFFILKDRKIAKYIGINLVFVFLINMAIKLIVARPRPELIRIVQETGYSFPSAHSMISISFYGFIMYFLCQKVQNKKIRIIIILLFSLLIIGIGISRIYLGVHYATDVLAGFLFGLIYLGIYIKYVYEKNLFHLK